MNEGRRLDVSRTYILEVEDGLSEEQLADAVRNSDRSEWRWVPEWDEDPDWDGARFDEPVAAFRVLDSPDSGEYLDDLDLLADPTSRPITPPQD